MNEQSDPDYALEISWMTFALRGHLSPLQAWVALLKMHFQNNAPVDGSTSFQLPDDSQLNPIAGTNITLSYAQVMTMLESMETKIKQIYAWQAELQEKALRTPKDGSDV